MDMPLINLSLLIPYIIRKKKQCNVFSVHHGMKSKHHSLNLPSRFIKAHFYYIYTRDKTISCV